MANKKTSINICTYNCKNIQSSIPEINDLCNCHDIVLLQETWMFRSQLPMLSSISNEFVGYGLSSMKDEQQIHTGRPFGGIAMLWRKSLNKYISIVTYDCDRIVGLKFESNSFAALFVCVYLPYDCSDNFDDYMFLLAKISQIIDEFQTPYVYVCGDFNANTRCTSQFGDELSQLCRCNSLCLADTLFLPQDTFTFISSSHDTVSWLDHILTTTSGYSILTDACVKTDFITSDHLPLCFTISIDNLHVTVSLSDQTSQDRQSYNWCGASDADLYKYYSCTRTELAKIKLPMEALQCEDISCTKHRKDIDLFYYSITNCLQGCVKQCIPKIKIHNVNSVAGWNEYVSHYYSMSRIDFKWWVSHNRPRHGPIYHAMRSSRAQFKYALRQCRLEELAINSTKLANYMQNREINAFWKECKKHTISKSALSNCVDGVTGEADIAEMWRIHYEELLNCNTNTDKMVTILDTFGTVCSHVGMNVTMSEVLQIVKDLPTGKSSGLDGLNGESMKHAHPLLCLLVSICFTSMFKHCYMPQSMINSVIIPIIKNKSGDFTDKNNYRPIALSSIISKVFEHTIVNRLEEYLWTNDNQFGFKSGHSTDLCIYALTEFIEYFKSRSTSVYVAFLDASKAFDKISHWTLFKKTY